MSDSNETLPLGWQMASLDDVAEIIRGVTFPSSEKRTEPTDGCVICLRTTNVQDQVEWEDVLYIPRTFVKSQDRWLQPSDTLISMANSYELVGKVALAKEIPDEATFGGFIAAIRTRGIDPKYLFFLLREPETKERIRRTSSRTVNIANISMKNLGPTPLRIAPLAEQRRIVAKIEALQERSRKAREALAEVGPLLEQFRQSLLAAAFRGDLTADWRAAHPHVEPATELLTRIRTERRRKWEEAELAKYEAKGQKPPKGWKDKYAEPAAVDASSLPELPDGWCWTSWKSVLALEVGAFKRGPFGSTLKKSIFVSSGYKVYEQYCPINADCSYVRYYITPEKYEELKSFAVQARDFLVSCSGVTLGRITQVPDDYEEGVINQALLRVRLNNEVVQDLYFKCLFRSPFVQAEIFDNSQGNAIPNVKGVDDLKAIPLPIPPLDEQTEVVKIVLESLGMINTLSMVVAESESALNQLDQSILAKAFRGELVLQDPNDEPASALLERIRQQRDARVSKTGKHPRKTKSQES